MVYGPAARNFRKYLSSHSITTVLHIILPRILFWEHNLKLNFKFLTKPSIYSVSIPKSGDVD